MNRNQKMILLVEDNPDDVELTRLALRESKIANELHVAKNGVEALEHLFGAEGAAPSPLPTIVLLDVKLPKVDGLEVLARIRADERTSLLPVVMLTSSKEERDLVESYRLRANSYIRKPVDFDQFAAVVRQLGLYWLVLNEPPPRA
ncbi:MAG TPA: response regulator [Anaeromyxobacteraceae bacterium]|nr:response regulator [Anaeromyxobacteraceae bacterium]